MRYMIKGSRVQVLALGGYSRALDPSLIKKWNVWLESFRGIRTAQIDCTSLGAVVYFEDLPQRGSAPPKTLVVGWTTEGLFKMSPD